MKSLNDIIWNPEDDTPTPQGGGIGTACMREICIVAFCHSDLPIPPLTGGTACGDYSGPTITSEYCAP